MTLNRDLDNLVAIAKEHQAEILRTSAASKGHRPAVPLAMGVTLAVVCAPLAALFFLQAW